MPWYIELIEYEAGIYLEEQGVPENFALGKPTTVFQAKLYIILSVVNTDVTRIGNILDQNKNTYV